MPDRITLERAAPCVRSDDCDALPDVGAVTSFPRFDFTVRDVRRAGEVVSGRDLLWTEERQPELRRAFTIANNWRDSHAYPMRSIRFSLLFYIRNHRLTGFTAARLKRMPAIQRKLRRMQDHGKPMFLNQLQDLGGCRAIMSTMDDVRSLVALMKERSRHEYRGENDYIEASKDDGYRCHHLKYAFKGRGDSTIHDGRRVEVQIRTVLQHAWATAIEAVGLFRGENLKGSDGSLEWLTLFQLMSAEFAEAERCDSPSGSLSREARMQGIKDLEAQLDALNTLESLSHASDWSQTAILPSRKPTHYLLHYNRERKTVEVSHYFKPLYAVAAYDEAEKIADRQGVDSSNVVLVEVDKIDNLRLSYPNYFGDVQLFKEQLRLVVKGQAVDEYTVARQQLVPPRPVEKIDPRWMTRRGRWT